MTTSQRRIALLAGASLAAIGAGEACNMAPPIVDGFRSAEPIWADELTDFDLDEFVRWRAASARLRAGYFCEWSPGA